MATAPHEPARFPAVRTRSRAPRIHADEDRERPSRHRQMIAEPGSFADDPDFRHFADLIAEEGYDAKSEGIRYRYLRVGDFLYWASRSLFTPGQNLNRRPASDVAGLADHEQATLPI